MGTPLDILEAALAGAASGAIARIVIGNAPPVDVPAADLADGLGMVRATPGWVIEDGVRVRSTPRTDTGMNIMGSFQRGAKVQIIILNAPDVGGNKARSWHKVQLANGAAGYVASEFVSLIEITPPVVVVPPTKTRAKMGLHYAISPNRENVLSMAKRLHENGTPIPMMTVINDGGLAASIAQYIPTVVFRSVLNADNECPADHSEHGGWTWVDERVGRMFHNADNAAIYYQFCNECGFNPGDSDFYIGVMKACEAHGRKAAILGYQVGVPEIADWARLTPALQYAKRGGHIVCLHAYGSKDNPDAGVSDPRGIEWYGLRYRQFYNSVGEDARPMLALGEVGTFNARNPNMGAVLADMKAFNALISQDSYVLGAAYWTVGDSGGFSQSAIDAILPDYEKWLKG